MARFALFFAPKLRSLCLSSCVLSAATIGGCGDPYVEPADDDDDDGDDEDSSESDEASSDSEESQESDSTGQETGSEGDSSADDSQEESDSEASSDETDESEESSDNETSDSEETEEESSDETTEDSDTGDPDDIDCDDVPDAPDYECDATDIEGRLKCIPGVTITSYESRADGRAQYSMTVEQEVVHGDPSKGTFQQRVVLAHNDETLPLILKTSGYGLSGASHELASLFDANVLSYEHRFFPPSVPAGEVPWEHLVISEAATDAHHLWESFKWIYEGPWVSTGASKGGETSVFHRRFYPCDLQATVAYVAPLVLGDNDPRFDTFLQEVGGSQQASCRQALEDAQIALLDRRDELVPKINASEFTILGAEVAFEHAVIELPFGFWQYSEPSTCGNAPDSSASTNELWSYLTGQAGLDGFNDDGISGYRPYFYQAARELGTPGANFEHLLDRLKHADTYKIQSYLPGIDVSLDPEAMPDVQEWVSKHGERLMFIYGSYDPWTAAAYELGDAKDSFLYTVEGGNHGSTINALSSSDRSQAIANLERWLGVRANREAKFEAAEIMVDRPRL